MTADGRSPQPSRDTDISRLCGAWFGDRPRVVRPGPLTGFSGTHLAIVELPDSREAFVVKAFRAGIRRDRAAWVHRFMRQARVNGVPEVPELAVTGGGDTLVEDATGGLWEAVRFMAGTAVTAPHPGQVRAGMELLARLHLAVERLPDTPSISGLSAGVLRRIEQAERLRADPWSRLLLRTVGAADASPLEVAIRERLPRAIDFVTTIEAARVLDRIAAFPRQTHALQPVVRDVWSDHVLFSTAAADDVSGLVDFHAAAVDVPATDIARLLGSWLPPTGRGTLPVVDRWPEALAAYERIRPLPPGSRALITWLEATGVLCGLDNWFRWVLAEQRRFPTPDAVIGRIDQLIAGLPAAVGVLSKCGEGAGLTP
jgi:Ser/Thr protein kinase RdoA (MazF antagonist)